MTILSALRRILTTIFWLAMLLPILLPALVVALFDGEIVQALKETHMVFREALVSAWK